jgi:hypothetical protein
MSHINPLWLGVASVALGALLWMVPSFVGSAGLFPPRKAAYSRGPSGGVPGCGPGPSSSTWMTR